MAERGQNSVHSCRQASKYSNYQKQGPGHESIVHPPARKNPYQDRAGKLRKNHGSQGHRLKRALVVVPHKDSSFYKEFEV